MKVLVYSYIIFLFSLLAVDQESRAQPNNFLEIRENLLMNRPQTGDPEIRKQSLSLIDEIITGSYAKQNDEIYKFYRLMLDKAMIEIKTEKVESGVTVWQIYNHGFVVKTPSILLAFDLYDYYGCANLKKLADSLDVMFITHNHTDHLSPELEQAMNNLNKPVIRSVMTHAITTINVGDSINEVNLQVTGYTGLHGDIAMQMFEVVTPEGFKIFHTGDNQTSEVIPNIKDVDILLLNAWVNESGSTSSLEGSRNAINKIKPKVTLPGHILELGHVMSSSYYVTYSDVLMVNDVDLGCEYYVLAWGERYHFDNKSNDSIRPNSIDNPQTQITNDSIIISWDIPSLTEDGENATFYRIVGDESLEFFSKNRRHSFKWDTIGNYKYNIYSYDHCGNQCYDPVEINATVPDINYPPRIAGYFPYSEDSIDVFSGVYKVFNLRAVDVNNDLLYYLWEFDGNQVQNGLSQCFIYDYSKIDTGNHLLSVSVTDLSLTLQHNWYLYHHNLMAIIDNSDTLMYSEYGNWNDYSNSSAYYGSLRYTYLTNIGAWASYIYYPEIKGYYNTSAFIPDQYNGSSLAVYYLLINQQPVDTINLDQYTGKGQWLDIGQYFLPDSSEVQIKVVNTGRAKKGVSLMADAVRFSYVDRSSNIGEGEFIIPDTYSILKCHPNPFSDYTLITLDNTEAYPYIMYIFNLNGEMVRIVENICTSTFILEKKGLKEGLYFIKLIGPINYLGKIMVL